MKATPIIIALAMLGAIPLQVRAQEASTEPAPAPEEPAPSEEISRTSTGTGTESVGNTGTGTGTSTVVMSSAPIAISLSAQNSWMSSNNSQPITVSAVVGSDSVDVTSGTQTVPLSSSHPACTVPASVDLAWNSREGGMATFQVTCSKISGKAQTVTITGGNASTSFTLKP